MAHVSSVEAAPLEYTVTLARREDLPLLAAIELAAAAMLAGHAPSSVLLETTSLADLVTAQRLGHLWVARDSDGAPVGFAQVKLLEPDSAHLDELDVHPKH